MRTQNFPIYNNRTVVGHAATEKQAKRILGRMLSITPGFTVSVWMRPDHICEITGLPKGWVYALPHESQTH